jgi:hypothetical protein
VDLGEAAAAFREMAARAESELALVACREAAKDYLAILRIVTPKRTGALADSEHIDAVFGGGTHATAVVAPHKVYADIVNDGGTVTRHLPRPHVLGNPAVGFFGHGNPATVTIKGRGYMEKAAGAAKGPVAQACQRAADEFFTLP